VVLHGIAAALAATVMLVLPAELLARGEWPDGPIRPRRRSVFPKYTIYLLNFLQSHFRFVFCRIFGLHKAIQETYN
jgi:hypothetical protein